MNYALTIIGFIALLLITWGLIKEFLYYFRFSQFGQRDEFLIVNILLAVYLFCFLEGSSLFHLLTRTNLIRFWILVIIATTTAVIIYRKRRLGHVFPLDIRKDYDITFSINRLDRWLIIFPISILMLVLGFLGFVYPSYYADSLTYHLPRVMHWAQNLSVSPYATPYVRQVQMPPFAEYNILNVYLLAGNDRLAAWVQLYALLVATIGVSNLTKKLGGSEIHQLLASGFCVTLPAAVLEASGTQNDIVVASWVIIAVSFLLDWMKKPDNLILTFASGLAIGFAFLSKATAYVFLLPFIIWAGVELIRKNIRNIAFGLIIFVVVLGVNLRHYQRNYSLFNTPLGPSEAYRNEILTPNSLISTIIRDIAANLRFTYSKIDTYTISDRILSKIHDLTGLDNNDPRISWYSVPTFYPVRYEDMLSEAGTPNPFHYILIVGTALFMIGSWKRWSDPIRWYVISLLVLILLYNSILKFQVAGIRLLTTPFMLWSPVVILVFQKISKALSYGAILFLIGFSFVWAINNRYHPLDFYWIGQSLRDRTSIYKISRVNMVEDFQSITNELIDWNCHLVGIEFGSEVWEYPFWLDLHISKWPVQMEYTWVRNETNILSNKNFKPCAIVTNDKKRRKDYDGEIYIEGHQYHIMLLPAASELDDPKSRSN